jgi:hypothetical protein
LSFWGGKRAAILAELGEIAEAKRLAQGALNDVRSRMQPYTIDHALLSQESWMMLLLFTIGMEGRLVKLNMTQHETDLDLGGLS